MRHRRNAAILIPLATAMLLAGCGSSKSTSTPTVGSSAPAASTTTAATAPVTAAVPTTSATTAGGNFNSCSAVTQSQAANALGQSVSAGVLGNATVEGGLACVFYGPAAPAARNPNVAQADTVRVVVVKGMNATKWYDDYKSKVPAQPISGFGDQAYYCNSAIGPPMAEGANRSDPPTRRNSVQAVRCGRP